MSVPNFVVYIDNCGKCGNPLKGWCTRDGPQRGIPAVLEPQEVKRFYTTCSECNAFHEYLVVADSNIRRVVQ